MKLLARRMAAGSVAVLGVGVLAVAAFGSLDFNDGLALKQIGERLGAVRGAPAVIALWPEASRLTAAKLLEKYGAPDSLRERELTWRNRGGWLRIAVYRDEAPARRAGIVEHCVRYDARVHSWRDLNLLGLGVAYEPIGTVLSAASASEEANILALNVAVDVIEGRFNVGQAREFYFKTLDLGVSGKSSPYTRGLRFNPSPQTKNRWPGQLWPMP